MTTFVSRAEWGARPPTSTPSGITTQGTTCHWEGGSLWGGVIGDHASCYSKVRAIQAYHMDSNGWSDIAYNALACPHDYLFEGRGPQVRSAANGTNYSNGVSTVVCYLGGEGDPFTDGGKRAYLAGAVYLGGGIRWGHRDWYSTQCPGDDIYAWVQQGAPDPSPPPPPPPPLPKGMTQAHWYLKCGNWVRDFGYGSPGDIPIVGDWNGDGIDTPGVFRQGRFYLRNSNSAGAADITFDYGDPTDTFILVGDWDGDGKDGIGVWRNGIFYLRNSLTAGPAQMTLGFGNPDDFPIAGRWKAGATKDSVGVKRGAEFYLRDPITGAADIHFIYGDPTDQVVIGDWNGDGVDTPCLKRGITYYVRNSNTSGGADFAFPYGDPADFPLSGRWDPSLTVDGIGLGR